MNRIFKPTLIETEIAVAGIRTQIDALSKILTDVERNGTLTEQNVHSDIKQVEVSLKRVRKYVIRLMG